MIIRVPPRLLRIQFFMSRPSISRLIGILTSIFIYTLSHFHTYRLWSSSHFFTKPHTIALFQFLGKLSVVESPWLRGWCKMYILSVHVYIVYRNSTVYPCTYIYALSFLWIKHEGSIHLLFFPLAVSPYLDFEDLPCLASIPVSLCDTRVHVDHIIGVKVFSFLDMCIKVIKKIWTCNRLLQVIVGIKVFSFLDMCIKWSRKFELATGCYRYQSPLNESEVSKDIFFKGYDILIEHKRHCDEMCPIR